VNLPVTCVFVGGTVAALYFFVSPRPADVYPIPMSEAYTKLVHVDFGEMSEGEKVLDTTKTAKGNGKNKVTWIRKGDMSYQECALELAPLSDDAAQTHITVTCQGGGAGDGAAAGMVHNLMRDRVIERVDATLSNRPYDKDRASATASRWPSDGVDGSLATAQAEALRMDSEMHKFQNEAKRRGSGY
jgi:hypothetical protein